MTRNPRGKPNRGRRRVLIAGSLLILAQFVFAATGIAQTTSPPQCTGIIRTNPTPDQGTNQMWAGATRAAAVDQMGGIWGDIFNSSTGREPPIQTSNFFWYDWSWIMLASNGSNCCWVQIGTGWRHGGQEMIYYQLQDPGEPLYDYWLDESPNTAFEVHYTLTFDPCDACTYDQYNHAATGWAYAYYAVQNWPSGTGTLLLQKPITFHPSTTQYASESPNTGDQIGGTADSPVLLHGLAYWYPAGPSGKWYWMDSVDANSLTAWGPSNTSPYAVSEPPKAYFNSGGPATDLYNYDKRCPS